MNYCIVTIDTEAHRGENPVDQFIFGKTVDGECYGIDFIMDFCEKYNCKGLFFVDVAEIWDYGLESIRDVMHRISKRGHDIGVHVHPDHMADPKRKFLYQYSYGEQKDILCKCTQKYEDIIGHPPVAFRAGKYSANRDTLDIISELGYLYDFSEFYGNRWCGIIPPITADLPCRYKGLVEFPVTSCKIIEIGSVKKFEKLDLEMNSFGFNTIVDMIKRKDVYVASLFLHSFSFVTRDNIYKTQKNATTLKYAERNIEKCINSGMRIISLSDISEIIDSGSIALSGNPEGSSLKIVNPFTCYLVLLLTSCRIIKTNKKALLFVMINVIVLICILLLSINCVRYVL